jgi:hypothetical protein
LAASITLAAVKVLSGDSEQDLMLLAIEHAAGQGVDGLCLVSLGLVVAYELEVHTSLYGSGVEWLRMHFRVNHARWQAGTPEVCTK